MSVMRRRNFEDYLELKELLIKIGPSNSLQPLVCQSLSLSVKPNSIHIFVLKMFTFEMKWYLKCNSVRMENGFRRKNNQREF